MFYSLQETEAACKEKYYDVPNASAECLEKIQKVTDTVSLLNEYNIIEPCYHKTSISAFNTGSLPLNFLKLGKTERPLPVRKRMFGRSWPLDVAARPCIVPSWSQLLADSNGFCIVSN